jgi:hypothetical protein
MAIASVRSYAVLLFTKAESGAVKSAHENQIAAQIQRQKPERLLH